ncbi:DUF6928 family protein [Streptomyces sp. NA13]|uniref:DUF6928 family protein n=1 Tax=Streptomyces sp. NA13 TaxID=2996051 RepID=UPI003B636AD7
MWEDGHLLRSLSLSPDSGVIENIGTPLPFEQPYWAGDRPADVIPWQASQSTTLCMACSTGRGPALPRGAASRVCRRRRT